MNRKDATTKLHATEASLKRWQTRLLRATNMVTKLDRQRRRYQLILHNDDMAELTWPVPVAPEPRTENLTVCPTPESCIDLAEVNRQLGAAIASTFTAPKIAEIAAKVHDDLDIPAALDRRDPLIAEKMTAARKAAEAAERKKMPLSGRDAMKRIKSKK